MDPILIHRHLTFPSSIAATKSETKRVWNIMGILELFCLDIKDKKQLLLILSRSYQALQQWAK